MLDRNLFKDLDEALQRIDVSSNSISTAITIIEKLSRFDPNDNLPKNPEDWFNGLGREYLIGSDINLIPSDHFGGCHELLITICAGEANFDLNTMETIALCINCYRELRAVLIYTDYWAEKEFNKWRKRTFKALYEKFGINFYVITPHAGRWTFDIIDFSSTLKGKKRK